MLSGQILFGVELKLGKHLNAVSRDGCQQAVGGYVAVELGIRDVEELLDAGPCEERPKAGVEALGLVVLIVAWHLIIVFQSISQGRLLSVSFSSRQQIFKNTLRRGVLLWFGAGDA